MLEINLASPGTFVVALFLMSFLSAGIFTLSLMKIRKCLRGKTDDENIFVPFVVFAGAIALGTFLSGWINWYVLIVANCSTG